MFFVLDSQSQNLRKGRCLVKILHFDFGKTKFNFLQNNFSLKTPPPIKRRNADDDNDELFVAIKVASNGRACDGDGAASTDCHGPELDQHGRREREDGGKTNSKSERSLRGIVLAHGED